MKIIHKATFIGLIIFSSLTVIAFGANKVSAGARIHAEHSTFNAIPYENGDMSYSAAYEYHDAGGLWQFGIHYTPTVSGTNNIEYALTPQMNLIFQENGLLVGTGILHSYVDYKDDDAKWLKVYWQVITGLRMPLGQVELDITAYYVFADWKDIDDFDLGDMDYGFSLTFPF